MTAFAVSVVIPLYNKQDFIRRTLQSAIDQSHRAAEIIVVDDQSSDGSVAEIADLIGPGVRLITQPNAGPGVARNHGIEIATSEWIAFLDADDLWQPNHLATLAEVAAAMPDAQLVAAGFRRLGSSDAVPSPDRAALAPQSVDFVNEAREVLCSSSVAVRKSALLHAGGFDARYPGEDIDLWLRLALDNAFAATARQTSFYVQDSRGLMNSIGAAPASGVQPIFETIARALADPRHAARHQTLRDLRDRFLVNAIKQELYRGDPHAARASIAECDRTGVAVPIQYRILARMPKAFLLPTIRLAVRYR